MKSLFLPVLAALPLVGCKPDNDFVQPPPPKVTVAHPEAREVVSYDESPATITGLAEVDIRARVRGFLEKVYFAEGAKVNEGDPLFLIEQAPFKSAVTAAEANLKNAEAARDLANAKLQRLKDANQKNPGAVSKLDIEIGEAELAQTEAVVGQMAALLEDANISLSYTTINAPTSGRMSRSFVDEGNLVDGTEGTLLAHVTDDAKARAYFEVPERKMIHFLERRAEGGTKLEQLEPVRLILADGTIYDQPGQIDFIDNRIDPDTRTASVRAVFPNPESKLASGLYALVGYPRKFPNELQPNCVLIPSSAIQRDLAGDFVWVIDESNTVRRRGVEAGPTTVDPAEDENSIPTRSIIILKGLATEDRVITAGLQRAREGAQVDPQMEGEAEKSAPQPTPEPSE